MFHIFRKMQKQQKRQTRNKIFIFSLLSGFISAVATILLTPKPGKEMRHIAAEKIKEAGHNIKEAGSKIGEKAEHVAENAIDKGSDVANKALNIGEKFIQRAKDTLKHNHKSEKIEEEKK